MSFWSLDSAARRYAHGRPYFHPVVIDRVRRELDLNEPLRRALDVACGSGQSMTALSGIANRVVGMDVSQAMVRQARTGTSARLAVARAETLPFVDAAFDLMTVALAFHWFDPEAFLSEASRVLSDRGILAIYNNAFRGRMVGDDEFNRWFHQRYLERYPTPPRSFAPPPSELVRGHDFAFLDIITYEDQVSFTVERLVDYLTTQSNIVAVVEDGAEDETSVRRWLAKELDPYFRSEKQAFEFAGDIWLLRRAERSPRHDPAFDAPPTGQPSHRHGV
jgi:SAM-dependent methyltransferase